VIPTQIGTPICAPKSIEICCAANGKCGHVSGRQRSVEVINNGDSLGFHPISGSAISETNTVMTSLERVKEDAFAQHCDLSAEMG